MDKKRKGKGSKFIVILAYFLFAVILSATVPGEVKAAKEAVTLSLHSKNPGENVAFSLSNMFPGDSVTQSFQVSVSYTGTITVHFQAGLQENDRELAKVLEMKVVLAGTGELLYEGMLADMPELLQELSTDSKSQTEELTYEITVELSTGVGNEYQNKSLMANLSWWAEGDDGQEEDTESQQPEEEEKTDQTDTEKEEESESQVVQKSELTDPPGTGDSSRIALWMVVMCTAMAVLLLIGVKARRKVWQKATAGKIPEDLQMMQRGQPVSGETRRLGRLFMSILLVIVLVLGLGITSLALIYQKVTVEDNLFVTGQVSICLNDDQPVFLEEMLFEPGMVVKKDFTLRNDSSCDVYYRLYFTEVEGEFAEELLVKVLDKDSVLFEGTLADMNGEKSEGADGIMKEGEERVMTIVFRVPQDSSNQMQGCTILFDLNADAVQMVNNPDGLFE